MKESQVAWCLRPPRLWRRLVFIEDGQMRGYMVDISPYYHSEQVYLCEMVRELTQRGLLIADRIFYVMKFHAVINLSSNCLIEALHILPLPEIYFKIYPDFTHLKDILRENEPSLCTPFHPPLPIPLPIYSEFIYELEEEPIFESSDLFDHANANKEHCFFETNPIEIINAKKFNQEKNTEIILDEDIIIEEENIIENNSFTFLQHFIEKEICENVNKEFINQRKTLEKEITDNIVTDKKEKDSLKIATNEENTFMIVKEVSEEMSPQEYKRVKVRERTIRDVMSALKIWRGLHENKFCNLMEAARIVGFSKKSLDDYYLVIRTAEIQGFDFANNFDEGMGELREFLKGCKRQLHGRLRKEVRSFLLLPDYDLRQIIREFKKD